MNYLSLIALALCFSSCVDNAVDMKWNNVKQTCTIDNYQQFLIDNSSSKHLPEIIDSLRLFWEREAILDHHSVCHGNCISILVNSEGRLLFEGSSIEVSKLKDTLNYWIKNPDNLDMLPTKEIVAITGLGDFEVSCGIVDIRTDIQLNPDKYSAIIRIVLDCYADLRNEYAAKLFNANYDDLNAKDQSKINMIVPIRIDFERHSIKPEFIPLPPDKETDSALDEEL